MSTLMSVCKCKLCNKDIITISNWCQYCKHYSFVVVDDELESELIRFGNFYLVFFPQFKEANVVSLKEGKNEIIHTIKLEELTPESAIHWANKLKTYAIFQ